MTAPNGPNEPHEPERRLFATIPTDDPLHRAAREGLAGLRASGPPELRELAAAVLDGRTDIRSFMTSSAFAPVLAAAAERSQQEMASLSPEERSARLEAVRREALARWENP